MSLTTTETKAILKSFGASFDPAQTQKTASTTETNALLEERMALESFRASLAKEQADLRVERANWERDRFKAERDELTTRVIKLQGLLDRERKNRVNSPGRAYVFGGKQQQPQILQPNC